MNVTSLSLTDMLETKMVYDGERQKVLAQNIANKDIPGYQAQDLVPLDFGNVLAAQNSKINLAVTSPMHIATPQQFTQRFTATTQKNTFEESSTGNTVKRTAGMGRRSRTPTKWPCVSSIGVASRIFSRRSAPASTWMSTRMSQKAF